MPHIHIDHSHGLSLQDAQELARGWAQTAQRDWAMTTHGAAETQSADAGFVWQFNRTGADGTLRVTSDRFVLDVRLGFLLGTFKDRIEAQLLKNLLEQVRR
jgi:hypothetical protein